MIEWCQGGAIRGNMARPAEARLAPSCRSAASAHKDRVKGKPAAVNTLATVHEDAESKYFKSAFLLLISRQQQLCCSKEGEDYLAKWDFLPLSGCAAAVSDRLSVGLPQQLTVRRNAARHAV